MVNRLRTARKKLWTCPKCGRKFERKRQSHSRKLFPLARYFEGKPLGKILYQYLKQALKMELGSFKVESLACCIHFVTTFTFAAVKIFKDKIRIDFSLSRKIRSHRITQSSPMSAHRTLYCMDLVHEQDINAELLGLIHETHDN